MPDLTPSIVECDAASVACARADGSDERPVRHPSYDQAELRNVDIEALRGYAISITFVAHLGTLVPAWNGWTGYFWLGGGVDLFFCLSGFLITRSLLASLQRSGNFGNYARTFWVRRLFRLFPAAFFWSTVVVLLSLAIGDLPALGQTRSLTDTWLASLFNVVNLQIYYCYTYLGTQCSGNALWHYWSLSLEEQFYLLIPLVLFFVRTRWLLVLFLAGGLVQAWIQRPWGDLLWFIRSDALLFGCVIALSMHYEMDARVRRYMSTHRFSVRAALGVFMTTLIVSARAQISVHYMGLVSLSAGAIVFIAASDQSYVSNTPWMTSAARYVGSRSYSLYLVHLPVLALTRDMTLSLAPATLDREGGRAGAFLIAIVISFALAEITYRLVEEPLRLFGRRITRSRAALEEIRASRQEQIEARVTGRCGVFSGQNDSSAFSDTAVLAGSVRQR